MATTTEKITSISAKGLADRYGTSVRWWRERMPELAAAGIASVVGRRYFARLADVDAWLANGGQVAEVKRRKAGA